jgi:multidrug resistance efflux pump
LREFREAAFHVQAARDRLENSALRATLSGIVAAIPVKVGDQVTAGTPVIKLARLDRIIVKVPVGASLVQSLHPTQQATVILPSLPPREVQGTVKLVNPIPGENMTYIVEVEFENPTSELLAGQPAQVLFHE